jgi:DNA-binding transcriptional ArsR family regulator
MIPGSPTASDERAVSERAGSIGGPDRERLVLIFSALSDPTRMEMFSEILRRGEVGCAEFDKRFAVSKSTISYHTKLLNAAGLIETRREGRYFFYRPRINELEAESPQLGHLLRDLF